MTKVIGARSGDVVAQYCNRSMMLAIWSETGDKRFQIRDWPRYCDDLEDIWIQPGDLDFRETDDAVIWDVWELL